MAKKSSLSFIGEALVKSLDDNGLTDQARLLRITLAWNQAVGPAVARRTLPHGFSRGVLFVGATSAAWQNELTYVKGDIIKKLNEVLGRTVVQDIRVQNGMNRTPLPWNDLPAPPPAIEDQDRRFAESIATDIRDPELRDIFENLAARAHRRSR